MELDLVVSGGTVIDGTGAPRFRGDVGVRGGRIAAVSRAPGTLRGARVVEAGSLAVAPGFVDVDSHVDWAVVQDDGDVALARWLRQGVTTAIGGACGFSPAPVLPGCSDVVGRRARFLREGPFAPPWHGFAEFLHAISARGVPLNVGFLVGQSTLAAQAGATSLARDPLAAVLEQTREALRAGAIGFSGNAAAIPGTLARPEDLAAVAALVRAEDGLLAVHARAYTRLSAGYGRSRSRGPHNVRAVRDLVEVARSTGVRLHVLHLALAGRRTWRTLRDVLGSVDAARAEGIDVGFDAAPYGTAVGPIQLLFPEWFVSRFPERSGPGRLRALKALVVLQRVLLGMGFDDVRLRRAEGDPALAALEGLSFAAIGRRLGMHPMEAQVEIARRVGMTGASVLIGTMSADGEDDAALRAILSHPQCCIATNAASARAGPQNPSVTGAFPRFLGRWVRELGLVSLEEAVRRMTSLPAERARLDGIGRIAEGCSADLTIFDPAIVDGPEEPERADAAPRGISAVLVSGVPTVERGGLVPGVRSGRVLTRGPAPRAIGARGGAAAISRR